MFWRPEIAPAAVVLLAPATPFATDSLRLDLQTVRVKRAPEGVYVQAQNGPQLLLLDGAQIGADVSVILPLDGVFDVRLAAAQTLHQALRPAGGAPSSLTAQRKWRIGRMIRALDARVSGASYRDVADGVLGEAFADSQTWRTSSARDVAIRLCRGALKLMHNGYLALLRGRN